MAGTIRKIVGWLMLLLGLVVLTGAVADSKVGGWLRAPNPPGVSASLAEIDRVFLRADRLPVRVVTADRPDLTVTVGGTHSGWVETQLVRHDRELQVRVSAPWWHRLRNAEPMYVEVQVPDTFAETLALEVDEGSLTVAGASPDRPAAWKALDLKAGTAKVEVRHVQVGMLTYSGQTGAFLAERVTAREADLRLVTGKVDLAHFAGALRVGLTTGRVGAQFAELTGPVRVEQVKGQLELHLPDDAGVTLDASVGRGVVHNKLPLSGPSASGQIALRGTLGAGTHAVDLRVETGEITLR